MMKIQEIPIAFTCHDASLIGVVHVPEIARRRGVLAIVAGGPQYRGGCCRQLVEMARRFAGAGIPVMRFDYRGLGDSAGKYLGFEHVEDDLAAAIDAFTRAAPMVEEVVLWGGCDAASAILINAWKYPKVQGMVIGNPWARTEQTRAAVERDYYLSRLMDKQFWLKVVKLQFNPLSAMRPVMRALAAKFRRKAKPDKDAGPSDNRPFTDRMLEGLQRFKGSILLVLSGLSLDSKEFQEMVNHSQAWQKAWAAARVKQLDLPDADQAFSTIDARNKLFGAAEEWLIASQENGG